MLERLLIGGFGGQGVMMIGKLLAKAALNSVPHLTYFPSYGAEVRGGTANCQVILSTEEIGCPIAEEVDSLILFNQPSTEKFIGRLAKKKGVAIVNVSMANPLQHPGAINIPSTEIADKLGEPKVANAVMLGAYLQRRPYIPLERLCTVLNQTVGKKGESLAKINQDALTAGWEFAEKYGKA